MKEIKRNMNFRSEKCHHNDIGYCKFGDQCRQKHATNVCAQQNCEKNCNSRHPIPCKYENKSKFLVKNVCAFSHTKSKSGSVDEGRNCESDLLKLQKEVESLRHENEKKQL